MGRRPLIEERKHPLYFKMQPQKMPAASGGGGVTADAVQTGKTPEWFMEQVMEGLSDACMLVDGTGRVLYINGTAKAFLSPRGRVLGRKLDAVLAHRQLSMLTADVYHTGKPVFTRLDISMPGERWRDDHSFHVSLVPLWITPTRRLVRIALRDTASDKAPVPVANGVCCAGDGAVAPAAPKDHSDAMTRMRNPLTILQGYLENLLDGVIKDPIVLRQTLLTMRKHTMTIEKLMETCGR
jgi:hypothetical protein